MTVFFKNLSLVVALFYLSSCMNSFKGHGTSATGTDNTTNGAEVDSEEESTDDPALFSLELRLGPGGTSSAVEEEAVATDVGENMTFYVAKVYDDTLFIENVTGTWSATGVLESAFTIDDNGAITITPERAGTGTLIFTTSDNLSLEIEFVIAAGPLAALKIRDAAANGGSEVTNPALTAGAAVTYYAAGYDSYGNYISDLSDCSWTATGVLAGTWTANANGSVTMTPTTIGSGALTITKDSLSDEIGTATVSAGSLAAIKIRSAAANGGSEATNPSLTSGTPVTYYAAGYDALGNYLGDQTGVTWETSGVLANTGSANANGSITLTPATAGSGAGLGASKNGLTDNIGSVTVAAGTLASIKIRSAASNGGSEANVPTLTAGFATTYYAAGYDATGNYVGDQSDATWSGSGVLNGTLTVNVGGSVTVTPTSVGTGGLTATKNSISDNVGTVTVIAASAVSSIKIRTAANGGGDEVTNPTLTSGTAVTYYAAAYDTFGNLIGDLTTAVWSGSGIINGTTVTNAGGTVTVTPTTSGTGGGLTATKDSVSDGAGAITVNPGALATLRVRTATNGGGSEVNNPTLTSGTAVTYYAAGYDAASNLIGDIADAAWSSGGVLSGRVTDNGNGSATINPSTSGANGTLTATKNSLSDGIGTATVNVGALASLKIRSAANNGGSEITTPTLTTLTSVTYYSAGYDAAGNFVQDVDGSWSSTSALTGAVTDNNNGSATIRATTGGTGTLTVTSNALSDNVGTVTVNLNVPNFTALSTTLDQLVIDEIEDIETEYNLMDHALNGGDSGDWDIPTLAQLMILYEAMEELRQYVDNDKAIADDADLVARLATVNYEVFNLTTTDTGDTFFVLKEQESDQPERHGWGTVVIHKNPAEKVIIECPHPVHDLYTERAGARLMNDIDALALIIAGSHRRVSQSATPEFFLNNKFSSADYRYSDPSHNTLSLFHYAALVFMRDFTTAVQVHGYSMVGNGVSEDIVISSGARRHADPATGNTVLTTADTLYTDVKTALEATASPWDALIFDGINLGTTTNVTGRTTILGNTVRTQGVGKFIQLETDTDLRDDTASRNEYIDALAGVGGL